MNTSPCQKWGFSITIGFILCMRIKTLKRGLYKRPELEDGRRLEMSNGRPLITAGVASWVAATGVVGACRSRKGWRYPSWDHGSRAPGPKAAGAPVRVNIASLEAGQQIVAEMAWASRYFIFRRKLPRLLEILEENVRSFWPIPGSESSSQPEYVDLHTRAHSPEVLVVWVSVRTWAARPVPFPEVASADNG